MMHQSNAPVPESSGPKGQRRLAQPISLTLQPRSVLRAMPQTERNIVMALKLHGPSNIVELSERLHSSASALRPHLGQLEDEGIVAHQRRIKGPGRPQYLFHLTPEGEEQLFPTAMTHFSGALVRFLSKHAPELLNRFAADSREEYLRLPAAPGDEVDFDVAINRLVEAVGNADYLPREQVTEEGDREVVLHHCPLAAIATDFPAMCEFERRAFEEQVPGSEVERTAWRLGGDSVCAYRVRAGDPNASTPLRLLSREDRGSLIF